MSTRVPILMLLLLSLALWGCGTAPAAPVAPAAPTAPADLASVQQAFAATYADIVYASYVDSLTTAQILREALYALVANPSPATHQAAQQAWLAAQEPYGQTEVYRFYGGPIDGEGGPEALLNSWPLDEVFVDYVAGDPQAGIINNPEQYPEITRELLLELNQVDSEESVTTGYHAIEFLLWGQDFNADGPGDRADTDYVVGGPAANPERRAAYLLATADLLVEHLEQLVAAWEPNQPDNYRTAFLALPPAESTRNILTGMGVLSKSELAGERIFTALDNQDQEDEHSCFSDNTHRDIITNAQGIRNVYLGSYTRRDGSVVAGTGLQDVVALVDPDLNERVLALSEQVQAAVEAIHVPFDQGIVLANTRPQVLDTVYLLQDQGDAFAEIATALGIQINTALPE
ncbi:MAG: hypothetical protein HC911_14985 [Chloroflexaceae bacterium]|nr:hypothetical protein [Chloroflexaceae bacterium]